MSVALVRVNFYAHEGYRMLQSVKEAVKIPTYIMGNNILIIPFPDNVSCSGFYSSGANVSWHSKLGKM